MENEDYHPVQPNYYNYKAKNYLTSDMSQPIHMYDNIHTCCYSVNNLGKYPFMRFLLTNSLLNKTLNFPQIPVFKNFDSEELINFSKIGLFGLLMLENFEFFNSNVLFNGFYEYNNNLYMFFDITECNIDINDVYGNNNLWMVLLDEILNHKNICNIDIDSSVTNFFTFNDFLCFLENEDRDSYELPVVGYVKKPECKLNFTYIFGESKSDKNSLLGPYYYFTPFNSIFQENNDENKNNKYGVVRFALFTGNTKYIENHLNDPVDESEIKKQRLNDEKINQNLEHLTMRISDHDGKWAETYDSSYLSNVELDNGVIFNKTILVLKEYEQQIPLSYHFISNKEENFYSIL